MNEIHVYDEIDSACVGGCPRTEGAVHHLNPLEPQPLGASTPWSLNPLEPQPLSSLDLQNCFPVRDNNQAPDPSHFHPVTLTHSRTKNRTRKNSLACARMREKHAQKRAFENLGSIYILYSLYFSIFIMFYKKICKM